MSDILQTENILDYDQAVAVVDAYLDLLNAGDLDGIVNLYHTDAMVEDPVGSPAIEGADAIRTFYKTAVDMKVMLSRSGAPRLAGNEVAFPFQCKTKTDDGFLTIEIIDTFKLDANYKVTHMRAFWGERNISLTQSR